MFNTPWQHQGYGSRTGVTLPIPSSSIASACSALGNCARAVASPPQTGSPELANSFASLSVALTFGSILLAAIGIIAAFGWGHMVRVWAMEEAKTAAAAKVDEIAAHLCTKWLTDNVPGIVREIFELGANETAKGGQQERFDPTDLAENVDDDSK